MTPLNTAPDIPRAPDVAAPDAQPGKRPLSGLASIGGGIIAVFRRSPEWLVIVFAWVAAGFIPAFWFMGEDHWWVQSTSPLVFEPFVPLLCAVLIWQDRERLMDAWQRTPRNKRIGSPVLLWVGCALILVSHLIHVLTVAAAGLLIAAAGVVYLGYGPIVLMQARRALLFGLLLIPPPVKPIDVASKLCSRSAWNILYTILLKLKRIPPRGQSDDIFTLMVSGRVYQAENTQLSAIFITGFVLLFFAVWRRRRFGEAVVSMAFGGLIAAVLTVLVPLIALLLPVTPLTDMLVHIHPLLVAAAAVGITVGVSARLGAWSSALLERSHALGRISQSAQKLTDRAASGVAAGMGGSIGRARRGAGKHTEAAMDKFFAAIVKPFKRKRRDRW